MAETLCLDASILLKLYRPEAGSREASQLVSEALKQEKSLVGPAFLAVAVLSSLRGQVQRAGMDRGEAEEAVDAFLDLPIEEVGGKQLYRRAWQIAEDLSMPTLYDAAYLAAAELRGATFWTADRKLFDRAREKPYVRFLGLAGTDRG